MESIKKFNQGILEITDQTFERQAIALFNIQFQSNPIYREYTEFLGVNPSQIRKLKDIPFLPIEFFKTHQIKTGNWKTEQVFKSSGTTKTGRSQHHILSTDFYRDLCLKFAEQFFGPLGGLKILALLPSYLDQGESSLVDMVAHFVKQAAPDSGFYLNNQEELVANLRKSKERAMIFGVSYALLDLADNFQLDLSKHLLVETGGMKGRKKEITRNELHDKLKSSFNCDVVYTEFGMTELLSQAYGVNGELRFPAWSKPLVRDLNDPFEIKEVGSGALNVIDLANTHSCAFIETKDLVNIEENGQFEVLGRMDNTDIRGCSLLL